MISPQRGPTLDGPLWWAKEIESLRRRTFASMDDAIRALAELVAARLSPSNGIKAQERKFLEDLFRTDMQLWNIIRTTLNIR